MGNTAVLDPVLVEDSLFGEPRVFVLTDAMDPDDECGCICSCRTNDAKITSNQANSAITSVLSPMQ